MFEFRNASAKADKYLKELYAIHLKKIETSKPCNVETTKPHSKPKKDIKKIKTVHKSVSDLFTTCPLVKIPTNLLSYDINPSVCMELDAVENYYTNNKLNMDKAVQLALKSLRPPKKKTDASKDEKGCTISVVSSKNISKRKTGGKGETGKKCKKIKLSTSKESTPPTLKNVHLCEVCESIENSSETLHKHISEHFRCNICTVRHILSNEAYVYLNRIDLDFEAIQLYPVLNKSDDKDDDQPLDTSQSSDLFCTADTEDQDRKSIANDSNTILVSPDIRIDDDNIVLNYAHLPMSETEFLKKLLTRSSSPDVKMSIQAGTQIDFPDSKEIVKHHKATAARFRALKPHLFAFKIPVHIRKGEFNVEYTTIIPNGTVTNKDLWCDLKPIGLKKTTIGSNTKLSRKSHDIFIQSTTETTNLRTDINQKKSSTSLVDVFNGTSTLHNKLSQLEEHYLINDSTKDLSLQSKTTPNGNILIESTTQTTIPSAGINQHKSSTDLVDKQQKIVGNE